MALKFSIDPATGVVKPPVTVFNGGAKRKSRKSKKSRKTRKSRKTQRNRR